MSLFIIPPYFWPIFWSIFTLSGTGYHDYEVGQEVHLYGFQSSAVNFGASTNTSWSLASGEVTVTISGVDNTLTSGHFSNWVTLGECGLKFNFSGTGSEALSKTYHIDNFSLGTGTPSLPGNTALGMGYARYNSSNTTITFVLKVADIATPKSCSIFVFWSIFFAALYARAAILVVVSSEQ